jgi:hypothetical protein
MLLQQHYLASVAVTFITSLVAHFVAVYHSEIKTKLVK